MDRSKRSPSPEGGDPLPGPFGAGINPDLLQSLMANPWMAMNAQQPMFPPIAQLQQLFHLQLVQQFIMAKKMNESSSSGDGSQSPLPMDLSPSPFCEKLPLASPPTSSAAHQWNNSPLRSHLQDPRDSRPALDTKPPNSRAWQSLWHQKTAKDEEEVFKCSHCKSGFSSLQALTDHMKETGHFFVPHSEPPQAGPRHGSPRSSAAPKKDILREPIPMPRKLVRGQDVWLGRGAEQTKNILKCIYCKESFSSLDTLTNHMRETKHYTKVISQEQMVGWGGSGSSRPHHPSSEQRPERSDTETVLSCQVCGETFPSLNLLGDHVLHRRHYPPSAASVRRSLKREATEPISPRSGSSHKKSKTLPVKTLLELERSKRGDTLRSPLTSPVSEDASRPQSTRSETSSSTVSQTSPRQRDSPKRSILGSLESMARGPSPASMSGPRAPVSPRLSPEPEKQSCVPSPHRSDDPLAALQQLCQDSLSTQTPISSVSTPLASRSSEAGSMVAFSWACNEAIAKSGDSNLIQCPYCDTPFASKGAYRHHMSKVHFTKEDQPPSMRTCTRKTSAKSDPPTLSPDPESHPEPKEGDEKEVPEKEESSAKKYQQFAEMARQLSSQSKPLSSPA